jgi:hypothetical protein
MPTCHDHNLREPLPGQRPYGIRVRLRRNDPFRKLLGDDWTKEHWFASSAERDARLAEMSGRYLYFRPGDAPALDFERVDP